MNRVLLGLFAFILAGSIHAQASSFLFPDSEMEIDPNSEPLIDPSYPHDPNIAREIIIAESFFRRIWSGINHEDEYRKMRVYSRFNLDGHQAFILQEKIHNWMNQTSLDAVERQIQMCALWSSEVRDSSPLQAAHAALDLHESLEPTRDRVAERLQVLIDDIGASLGDDFVAMLMQELDRDYEQRTNLSYRSWANLVRSRGNAVEQLEYTCTGAQ